MHNKSKKDQPIIIFGTGRSGSTIISEIVFSHHRLAWPSNYSSKFPKILYINFIRSIFQNRFWYLQGQKNQLNKVNKINKYLFRPDESYPLWNYLTGDDDFSRDFLLRKAGRERIISIRKYFEKMVKFQGRDRLSFKIVGPSRIQYLSSIFPDAYFIEVKRKPLPTISSMLKVPFWKDKGYNKLWFYGAYSDKEIDFARKIKNHPALISALQYAKLRSVANEEVEKTAISHLSVDYEDFMENPKVVIEEILNFVNLDFDKKITKYLNENQIHKRNMGVKNYFDKTTRENINYILHEKYDLISI